MQARINGVRVIPTEDEEQITVIRWAEMQAGLSVRGLPWRGCGDCGAQAILRGGGEMRKESYRDYAVAAITDWLEAGEPGVDACKRGYKGATRADMIAAACAVSMVTKTAPDAGEAVRAVYGNMAGGARRGEITARVVRFAMDRHVGERQVWEWLARVRREFAQARGLRCERVNTNNARKT